VKEGVGVTLIDGNGVGINEFVGCGVPSGKVGITEVACVKENEESCILKNPITQIKIIIIPAIHINKFLIP